MGCRIFVNIDDAGRSDHVNEALEACIQSDVVDGASILATGSRLEDALRMLEGTRLELTAHLDAVEGPFLLNDVSFPRSALLWALGMGSTEKLEREWRAQIESLLDSDAHISRLDSHRHLHHLPRLREMFLRLAGDYELGEVRAAILPPESRGGAGALLHRLGKRLREMALEQGLSTNSCVLGFGKAGGVDREYLLRVSPHLPEGKVELVMHPSTRPEWSSGQPGELALLQSDWFRSWKTERSGG